MEDPEAWRQLRDDQENVVSLAQILAHDMTVAMVRANVAARRWIPMLHGVYAVVTGEPTPSMWRRAALLFIRGPAVLSHATAAAVMGLPGGSEKLPVHVTVPYGSSARGCAEVIVHRSRAFAHIVARGTEPPMTTRAQTLLDVAVDAPDAKEGMRILTAGATTRRVPPEQLLEIQDARPPRRYRRALRAATVLMIEGVESVLEADYANRVELAHRLPVGARQIARVVEGHRRAEDIEYDMPLGVLTVRIDGWRTHANRRTARVDRARDNAAELEGRARLTFGSEEIQGAPCTTARLVAARLAQLGWDGELTRCPACP